MQGLKGNHRENCHGCWCQDKSIESQNLLATRAVNMTGSLCLGHGTWKWKPLPVNQSLHGSCLLNRFPRNRLTVSKFLQRGCLWVNTFMAARGKFSTHPLHISCDCELCQHKHLLSHKSPIHRELSVGRWLASNPPKFQDRTRMSASRD